VTKVLGKRACRSCRSRHGGHEYDDDLEEDEVDSVEIEESGACEEHRGPVAVLEI